MQFNLITDYALRCLMFFDQSKDRFGSSKEIAAFCGISEPHAKKVLRILKNGGIIESIRGINGGFSLARPLEKVTLSDVLSLTEETVLINRCLEEDCFCSRNGVEKQCPIHSFYETTQGTVEKIMKSLTIRDMIDGKDIS